MKRSISSVSRNIRDLFRDQAGATAILFGFMAVGLMGTAGLTIDAGRIYAAKKSFDADTQAAALVGANALQQANATQGTVQTAVTNWTTANPSTKVAVTSTNVSISCDTATANLPSCNGTTANVANVTRTATVSTNFLKAVGFPSITLTSTSSAAKAGGTAVPLNVMFVLDATGSMGDTDSGCTIPGLSGHPSRFQCAEYSIQSVLKTMPTSLDKVGLMIFPGMATQYSPTAHPCPTQPNSTPYYTTNIKYQIGTALDATYNNGSGALNDSSPLVQAVGDVAATPKALTGCVTNKGGQGSYAAEVLTKAQAALPIVAGTQNVIIFLSDGDFNASSSQLNNQTSKTSKQCDQAIAAAQAATAAGTTVYAVAYGASTSGCGSTGDTHNPCTTMQAIASDKTRFYSTSSTCQMSGAPNAIPSLPDAFKAITTNLTKPRLVVK
jgi:Flp pilus assembly protein TadG